MSFIIGIFKKYFDRLLLIVLLVSVNFCHLACETVADETVVDMEIIKKPRPRPMFTNDPWIEKYKVDANSVGLHAQMARSSKGEIGIAYWSQDGTDGDPCDEIEVDDPPLEVRWQLYYAKWIEAESSDSIAAGAWEVETVANPRILGIPPGLDLHYQKDGTPMITALSGEVVPEIRYCGGSDLGLFTPSDNSSAMSWDVEWVVTDSDQAMSGDEASDYGYVVGYWPSIATHRSGKRMVVYQDVHGGSLQRDDLARADLEVALQNSRGSSWSYEVIDLGEGAGTYNQAGFTKAGVPVVLYYISIEAGQTERMRQGLWLAAKIDDEWQKTLVFAGATKGAPSMLIDEEGVSILYYDLAARQPVLKQIDTVQQIMGSTAWKTQGLGDVRYNEGQSPKLFKLPTDRLAAVWYRCGSVESEECRPIYDAAIFSWETEEGMWEDEIIENGEEAPCGLFPSITLGSQNSIWASWQCARRSNNTGLFQYQLESARRELRTLGE
jgi:hypothetical protein